MKLEVYNASNLPAADWDTGKSDPYLIITVVEKGKQLFRFNTEVHKASLDPNFEESFTIPGITTRSKIVFTAVDKDEVRDQFLGQAVWELASFEDGLEFLRYESCIAGHRQLGFGPVRFTVLDRGGKPINIDYGGKFLSKGSLVVSVRPVVDISAMCGHLNGVLDSQAGKSSKKRLWAMLVDDKLSLFKSYGDMTPKAVCPISMSKVCLQHMSNLFNRQWQNEQCFCTQILINDDDGKLKLEIQYAGLLLPLWWDDRSDNNRWRTAVQVLGSHPYAQHLS